eukprot:1180985-Prorocentrum_minimum.AAC.2
MHARCLLGPYLGGFVDVGAAVLQQRLHNLQVPLLRGHVDRGDAVLIRPVHLQLGVFQQLPHDARVALL